MTQKTLFDQEITLEEAEELIKNGADVNERNEYGDTPLFYTLNMDIAELLIKSGANVNERNYHGQTPLHTSFFIGQIEFLLNHGAHINTKDGHGFCVLDYLYDIENIKFVIGHGGIGRVKTYKVNREYFSEKQQNAFDAYMSITNNDDDFFQMCLAYQEGVKNNVSNEIKDMDIV